MRSAAISGDGRTFVCGCEDGTVREWDIENKVAVGEPLLEHEGGVSNVAISGDGQTVVSSSWDETVRV